MLEEYVKPTSLTQALEIVDAHDGNARVLAGGTDLVVDARIGKREFPRVIVDLSALDELRSVDEADGELGIGALVTHRQLLRTPSIHSECAALADACALIGAPATPNVGTLGGNLANGSPAMDTGSPLLVVGARVRTRSVRGERTIALAELLAGPGRIALKPGELIVSVIVPRAPGRGTAYVRLGFRRAMEIAVVGAAASIQLDSAGCCSSVAVALTAVAPTCVLVPDVEAALLGRRPTDELLETAARAAADVARPLEDVRASAAYRGAMVPLIARRALDRALRRAIAGTQES